MAYILFYISNNLPVKFTYKNTKNLPVKFNSLNYVNLPVKFNSLNYVNLPVKNSFTFFIFFLRVINNILKS